MELNNLTITKAHRGLVEKEFSAVELTRACLDKVKAQDKKINAFLQVSEDLALKQAKEVDSLLGQGKKISMLAGIPLAIKDNILVKGERCTAGSKILENYIAPYDATVVKKLKSQGAVILGKTNLDEFAMGGSTENSGFGPTKNPLDLTRVPGGSSGGSAASVRAGECYYALGSDTGGSIRQPASFCGVVGLKPTYGAVSRFGLIAFASSLDQIGPIAKTVEDCQIVFDIIKGRDPLDSTSVESKLSIINFQFSNLRIGVPKEYFTKGIEPEVEKVIKEAIKKIEEQGVRVEEVSLPHTEYALASYYLVATSEASSNLARYDGVKYGMSKQDSRGNLMAAYLETRAQGFGKEVKRRIMLGIFSLSAGYYDGYYLRAQKVRAKIKQDFESAFQKVDLLLTPTSPFLPFKLGERLKDPLSMYLADVYTVSVNLAGLPALSLPAGNVGGLSVGLQMIGDRFSEDKIFTFANFLEKIL